MKNYRLPRKGKILCAALIATFPAISVASDIPAYRMAVVSDLSEGRAILFGAYEKAVSRLETKRIRSQKRFSTYNNLCVAYTKTNNLEKAVEACDAALADTESRVAKRSRRYNDDYPAVRRDHAVALSNRGVLHAVSGNSELARLSFEEALEMDAFDKDPSINLALLKSMMKASPTSEY